MISKYVNRTDVARINKAFPKNENRATLAEDF